MERAHKKLIEAWANDSSIQIQYRAHNGAWIDTEYPSWDPSVEFRIKPTTHSSEQNVPTVDGKPLTVGEICIVRALRKAKTEQLKVFHYANDLLTILQREQKARRAAAEDYHSLAY